jgi:methylenetetrahydrofolate--tRNA-(uracil-5-)-methyltransferase
MIERVIVIGAGLAGSECAWQIAQRGVKVELYEARPKVMSPAHKTQNFAELVCSNSFGSLEITSGAGLLKQEMECLDSLIVKIAKEFSIPAGTALATDREKFSAKVTAAIKSHPNIKVFIEEVKKIPRDDLVVVATGPLTSESLSNDIECLIGDDFLYFYDAIAPIVDGETIDYTKGFWGSRYGKGGENDYFNCPLTKDEYDVFYQELLKAEKVIPKDFEKAIYFEGCMPIEAMAERGYKTLLFGPLKPEGLIDPKTNKKPYAVVQLRRENIEGTLFSLVGFQTKMTYPEQKRVFKLIPCLANAVFVQLGSMHRNTFIQSNKVLTPFLNLKGHSNIFFAGQISGVEGYTPSAATGLLAAINAVRYLKGLELVTPPQQTMLGALVKYITSKDGQLQPTGAVMGLLPPLDTNVKDKQQKKKLLAERALSAMREWKEKFNI